MTSSIILTSFSSSLFPFSQENMQKNKKDHKYLNKMKLFIKQILNIIYPFSCPSDNSVTTIS